MRPLVAIGALTVALAAAPASAHAAPTRAFAPAADASVSAAQPTRNFGTARTLVVGGDPRRRAFVRFTLGARPAPGERFALAVHPLRDAPAGVLVRHADDRPWPERRVTERSAPRTGPLVVRSGPLRRGRWALIDVTRVVGSSGAVSLAIAAPGRSRAVLASRERASLSPRLIAIPSAEPLAAAAAAPDQPQAPPAAPPAPRAPAVPPPGPVHSPPPSPSSALPCGTTATPPAWRHVVWIVLENKGYDQLIDTPGAPYLNRLATECGLATAFTAETHPSLPNYLAMTSGSTQGVTDDAAPAVHPLAVPSIFSQLGGDWRALNESMPSDCALASGGSYAVRHNPAAYYTNVRAACATQDVPLGATPDVSARFTFITPNLCSDMHDCGVATGDAWLATWIPRILDSPEYRSGTTALFITCDEDGGVSAQHVPTIVVAPSTPSGTVDSTPYTHYSMLRTAEEMLGLPVVLGAATTATSMRAGLNLG